MNPSRRLFRIRVWIVLFVVCLVASGVTAFPIQTEVNWLHDAALPLPDLARPWLDRIHTAVNSADPLLAYGTDWLAFAHIVIGLAFIGPYRDPVRNIWIVQWAMLCCVAVLPLALIMGPIRGIPFWWTMIDMSFGIFGIIPLIIVYRQIRRYETESA